jgi:hypothetical protein
MAASADFLLGPPARTSALALRAYTPRSLATTPEQIIRMLQCCRGTVHPKRLEECVSSQPFNEQAWCQRAQQPQPQQRQQPQQRAEAAHQQPQRMRQQASVGWQQQQGWLKQGGGSEAHGTWQQDRPTLVLRPLDLGAARRLRRLLHSSGELWPVFRQPPLLPHPQPPRYVSGYPRFADCSYSFRIVDPWPEDWAENWYATMTFTSITTTATTFTTVPILKKGLWSRPCCS